MKRIFCLSALCLLCAAGVSRGQDAAAATRQESEENYKILKGHIDDLLDDKSKQSQRIQELAREISELRAQVSKPTGNYASPEDIKRLADAIQEVDKKRMEDNDKIVKALAKLEKVMALPPSHPRDKDRPVAVEPTPATETPDRPMLTYTIKDHDYLSTIAQAYTEKGIKVTVDQILKANPGLKPTQLYVGKKILIPDTRVGASSGAK